jgi:hypothetical protein
MSWSHFSPRNNLCIPDIFLTVPNTHFLCMQIEMATINCQSYGGKDRIFFHLLKDISCAVRKPRFGDLGRFFKQPNVLPGRAPPKNKNYIFLIRNCWTEMLARSQGHIIILVHFRSKR